MANDEEPIKTPCCPRAIGSICFEEGLQNNGKCSLCQVHLYIYKLPSWREPSDDASEYKVRFISAIHRKEKTYKAPLETSTFWSVEQPNSFSIGSAVADDPPPLTDFSESLIVNAAKNQKNQILKHCNRGQPPRNFEPGFNVQILRHAFPNGTVSGD